MANGKSPMEQRLNTQIKPPADYLPVKKRVIVRDYTDDEVQRALYALIAFGGSAAPARRALLAAFDLDVPAHTLRSWREGKYAQRYTDLQVAHGTDIEDALIRDTRDIARAAGAAMREAIDRVYEGIGDPRLRATEAAQIAAAMSKVQAASVDKLLSLTGRPQVITETRSAADIIRALEAKGVIVDERRNGT